MKKSYVSPDFEFLEIEFSDPICGSVEVPASSGDWGGGEWETWGDQW